MSRKQRQIAEGSLNVQADRCAEASQIRDYRALQHVVDDKGRLFVLENQQQIVSFAVSVERQCALVMVTA